jgi:hypothetical protein
MMYAPYPHDGYAALNPSYGVPVGWVKERSDVPIKPNTPIQAMILKKSVDRSILLLICFSYRKSVR